MQERKAVSGAVTHTCNPVQGAAAGVGESYAPHAAVLQGLGAGSGAQSNQQATARTLFAWSEAVGPHLAAAREGTSALTSTYNKAV